MLTDILKSAFDHQNVGYHEIKLEYFSAISIEITKDFKTFKSFLDKSEFQEVAERKTMKFFFICDPVIIHV